MITLTREEAQELLNALTYVGDAKDIYSDTIDMLRSRLAQPEREWQGLTDEELKEIYRQDGLIFKPLKFYRAIEAKLKEKNT
jgi:uncharacterized protein YukE